MPASNSCTDMSMPVIQLVEIVYAVNGHAIFDGVNLAIAPAETFAVMGLSGTGKTTLLRLISGLIRPTAGSLLILGRDITRLSEQEMNAIRAHIGLVFQYGALFDSLNVRENVGFHLYEHTNLREAEIRARVSEKLALVGMSDTEDLLPSELSGGMQKRAGIARALISQPKIMLYDEPTSGLDPVIAATINELIVRLAKDLGVTSVVVSHDVKNVMRIADRIALLYERRIHLVGTPVEYQASQDPVVRQFLEGSTNGPIRMQ